MSPTGLIAELRAALDEDEAVVRRNTDGRGLDGGFPDYRTYVDEDTSAADAYIDRFNPARVLADIAAKRAILDVCQTLCDGDSPMVYIHAAHIIEVLAEAYGITA